MKKIPEPEFENDAESEAYWDSIFESDDVFVFDWHEPGDFLTMFDILLARFGLEVIVMDNDGEDFTAVSIGRIEEDDIT